MTVDRDELLRLAAGVRLAVFDIDGVMTDGRLYRDDEGHEIKAFHSRDGLGLKGLMRNDFAVAALTARRSRLVEVRMAELGIDLVVQGREDKAEALAEILAASGIGADAACYVGDDLVDWPAMRTCRLAIAPADADAWIAAHAHHVTTACGGRGAVREVCELLLKAHGRLETWRAGYGAGGET